MSPRRRPCWRPGPTKSPKSTDGVRTGYDLPLLRALKKAVSSTLVASGGAGTLEHFFEAVQAGATVLLAASVFHFGIISIPQWKEYLRGKALPCHSNGFG